MLYNVNPITINQRANPRFADASSSEIRRAEINGRDYYRCIGGDKGDLRFNGYIVDGDTTIIEPVLYSGLKLTDEEANEIAQEVFDESFASIGIESIGSD